MTWKLAKRLREKDVVANTRDAVNRLLVKPRFVDLLSRSQIANGTERDQTIFNQPVCSRRSPLDKGYRVLLVDDRNDATIAPNDDGVSHRFAALTLNPCPNDAGTRKIGRQL